MLLEKIEKEELFVGNVDIDIFSHHLRLTEHLRTFFGLPPIHTEKTKRWWPRLVTVPMRWSHSVTISQARHGYGELLFFGTSLGKKDELKEENSQTNLKCRCSRYIDDFFVLGTDKRKVMWTYDRVWGAFEQAGLTPKPSKGERLHKN